jgi:hypothetical protein
VLCDAVWAVVDCLEKAKRFEDAASLCQALLELQFLRTHRKRGAWFQRLVIDLKHLKKSTEHVVQRALQEVRGSNVVL